MVEVTDEHPIESIEITPVTPKAATIAHPAVEAARGRHPRGRSGASVSRSSGHEGSRRRQRVAVTQAAAVTSRAMSAA